MGNPDTASWPGLHRHFGTSGEEELRRRLGDDLRWIAPLTYRHPEVYPMWRIDKHAHGAAGPFANCASVAEAATEALATA